MLEKQSSNRHRQFTDDYNNDNWTGSGVEMSRLSERVGQPSQLLRLHWRMCQLQGILQKISSGSIHNQMKKAGLLLSHFFFDKLHFVFQRLWCFEGQAKWKKKRYGDNLKFTKSQCNLSTKQNKLKY